MPAHSASGLVQAIRRWGLLEPDQLQEFLRKVQARNADPRTPFTELVERGWLSRYQWQKLLHNRGHELVLGSYVLIEKLGEGGMGEVFKARHQKMGRLVAVKVIRKDRLKNPESVQRFKREIQATAQLSHPNIVMALDADQAGDMHFLVMEHVEGIDLGRLTRASGPQPVPQACDYIRQGALGLQHAFEKGLVHRDIKPTNLLLATKANAYGTTAGTVKLLDLGLARLQQPAEGDPTSNLTQLGKVVGTVDFIAPEQALDSRKADVRSDLYSLGGTFFFILTRKIPFPGDDPREKVMKHQMDEPPAVEQLRPEVPAGVSAIIRKLLAKKPEDRYQTPAELAAALAPFSKPASSWEIRAPVPVAAAARPPEAAVPVAGVAPTIGDVPVAALTVVPDSDSVPVAVAVTEPVNGSVPVAGPASIVVRRRQRRTMLRIDSMRWLLIAALLAVILFALALGVAFLVKSSGSSQMRDPGAAGPALVEGRFTNSLGMPFVLIRPGTFLMGSAETDALHEDNELPQHPVTMSQPYYLGVHEVTQREFEKVTGRNPAQSRGADSGNLPVESVTWDDAVDFCTRLTALEPEHRAGRRYRLPTEAEWEYGCRAGSKGAFCFGDDRALLNQYAWWGERAGSPHPVGSRRENAWGLCDVHGNVWEWCSDYFDAAYYRQAPAVDPSGPASGSERVCRGGCSTSQARDLRAARRWGVDPRQSLATIGFRVACAAH
jgi:formylglycine-generating enzyme required for sulfatase activity/tRNA A-37 threonylcarbamoyl transferase component Bud32